MVEEGRDASEVMAGRSGGVMRGGGLGVRGRGLLRAKIQSLR